MRPVVHPGAGHDLLVRLRLAGPVSVDPPLALLLLPTGVPGYVQIDSGPAGV